MKRIIATLLFLLILHPAMAAKDDIFIDEICGFDEITMLEIENCEEEEEDFGVIDRIYPDIDSGQKHKVNVKKQVKTFEPLTATDFIPKENPDTLKLKKGDFIFSSTSRKSNNDYMKEILRQRTEAKYERRFFEVATGLETKYENSDASKNSQNLFFAPKLKLGEQFSFILNNKTDPTGSVFEQEVGLNFKPKMFENSTFGVVGGTVFKNGVEKSQKMRFSSDFYLW